MIGFPNPELKKETERWNTSVYVVMKEYDGVQYAGYQGKTYK